VSNNLENHPPSFSIRIFLAEGSPSGLKFVEKSNWIGLGVVCPRPRLSSVKCRKEFDRAAVYVLIGPSDTSDLPIVYIGEGDPVRTRLEDHHSKKDFWTISYFFTSKDANLNKAHIQYLEYRLITLANEAKRCKFDNLYTPTAPSLSEPELADMEIFLEEILLCFPVLGVSIFEKPDPNIKHRQILILKNKGVHAVGFESEDGFVVKRGSTAVIETAPSIHTHVLSLRADLQQGDILVKHDSHFFELTRDYEFTSPSLAATFLLGANINGRDWWKTEGGVTLKQLQEKSEDNK